MIVENSQDTITCFDLDSRIKNVGIKCSGGADSAIVFYMLCKYVETERPDITIIPITFQHPKKPYNFKYSAGIIEYMRHHFDINFGDHIKDEMQMDDDYIQRQMDFVDELYDRNVIDFHYAGITANPPYIDDIKLCIKFGEGPVDDRDPGIKRPQHGCPLTNIDKKGVAELYTKYDVLETLFPLTRSCESLDMFDGHCAECWFCGERHWGFGRYV